jgi:hypothetical protein
VVPNSLGTKCVAQSAPSSPTWAIFTFERVTTELDICLQEANKEKSTMVNISVTETSSESQCVYCKEPVEQQGESCPECQVRLHKECWQELKNRCPTTGCSNVRAAQDAQPTVIQYRDDDNYYRDKEHQPTASSVDEEDNYYRDKEHQPTASSVDEEEWDKIWIGVVTLLLTSSIILSEGWWALLLAPVISVNWFMVTRLSRVSPVKENSFTTFIVTILFVLNFPQHWWFVFLIPVTYVVVIPVTYVLVPFLSLITPKRRRRSFPRNGSYYW